MIKARVDKREGLRKRCFRNVHDRLPYHRRIHVHSKLAWTDLLWLRRLKLMRHGFDCHIEEMIVGDVRPNSRSFEMVQCRHLDG